jgi:hypothetical protein
VWQFGYDGRTITKRNFMTATMRAWLKAALVFVAAAGFALLTSACGPL